MVVFKSILFILKMLQFLMNEYYLIKQTIPYLKTLTVKIYPPFNTTHLKNFISIMAGQINVYKYNDEDNSRIDLTSDFGVENFNVYEHSFEKFSEQIYLYTSSHTVNQYFKIYCFGGSVHTQLLVKQFYMAGSVCKLKSVEYCGSNLFLCNIDEYRRLNNIGSEYEKFISKKYEESGYFVQLNGIKKGFEDGGIDLIAIKKDNIVLVQCKNWALSNNNKINQKDLRAFVGDCFLYLKDRNLYNKKVSYHFIVSHDDILTKSAEIFLNKNTFIKFKCIPFEL